MAWNSRVSPLVSGPVNSGTLNMMVVFSFRLMAPGYLELLQGILARGFILFHRRSVNQKLPVFYNLWLAPGLSPFLLSHGLPWH